MKPISSAITGALNQASKAASSTGSAHGEIGYAERRRTSSRDDYEPSETYSAPAVRTEAALPSVRTTTCFADLPPLPPVKPVIASFGPNGTKTALALANSSDLPALRSLIGMIREELRPESPEAIGRALVRLFSHYHAQAGADMEQIAEDWIDDMADVSAKGFHAAVTRWRRSTQRFRPTPGQLLAWIEEIEAPLRSKLAQCLALELEAMEG